MSYLVARVENFSRFEGESLTAEPVMAYAAGGKVPHELYNFYTASDGFIYGYMPMNGGGNLQRLGGDPENREVSNVTVIFISGGLLCGYYRDATVFSEVIRPPDFLYAGDEEIYCRLRVDPENAYLIPADARNAWIDPAPIGSFPVLYGDMEPPWAQWFENHVQEMERQTPYISEGKRRRLMKGAERSTRARDIAIQECGLKCECCGKWSEVDDLPADNIRSAVFEVHHKIPYAEDFETRQVKQNDLAVLCANCHRMIHKMPDISDIEALRRYLGFA